MAAVMAVSLTPLSAKAADAQHYELTVWTANGTGISFSYQGPMGMGSDGLACGELMYPHAKDPSWTGADSAAPILAYIKAYGITSEVKRVMNPTVFDPTVLQALSAQGVNPAELGGPNIPPGTTPPASLLGKAIIQMPAASAHLVGLGIPTPDLNNLSSTPTPKAVSTPTPAPAPVQSKQPTSSTPAPTPNPQIPRESTPSGNTSQTQTPIQAVIPPTKTDTTNTEVASTTPAGPVVPPKVVPPALQKDTQTSSSTKAPWKIWLYAGIVAVVALGGGVFGRIKWKQRNA